MNSKYLRRGFLRKIAALAGTMVLSPFVARSIEGIYQSNGQLMDRKLTPRINPAFRFQYLNDGGIQLFTFQTPGSKISYQYNGLEADILLMIRENKPTDANLKELAGLYLLNDTECKIKISSAMSEFEKKGLIYYGDLMIARKTEEIYE
jgi:hypothetical protein